MSDDQTARLSSWTCGACLAYVPSGVLHPGCKGARKDGGDDLEARAMAWCHEHRDCKWCGDGTGDACSACRANMESMSDPKLSGALELAEARLLELSAMQELMWDAEARAEAAEARLAEAREVLRSVEWASCETCCDCCPFCGCFVHKGHAPDCRLRAVLGDGDG